MSIDSITHPFYDIEVEQIESSNLAHLVKILSIDGRRFTYELHGGLTEAAVTYIKSMIDSAVFSDLVIEHTVEGYEAREARKRLKKHS